MHLVTKFLLSALSPEQFPAATAPEFAFLGRSNVGKSSLINGLLGEKGGQGFGLSGPYPVYQFLRPIRFATARLPRLLFADLPGYGYAKISSSISAEWPKFINPYLEERANLVLCVCLVDSNIPVQASDQQLMAALKGMGRRFVVVGTKADRLSGNERAKALGSAQDGVGAG